MIYFDNAASTWPKPNRVGAAMQEAIQFYAANPGRGGHKLSMKAGEVVTETRLNLAKMFHTRDERHIIFQPHATGGLNQVIKGLEWNEGDEIISTTYEHNSVRRPLEYVRQRYGAKIHYIQPDINGNVALDLFEKLVNKKTKLIVTTHVSNLTGAILPVEKIGKIAKQYGVPFLVDASQSAGMIPIDVHKDNIDFLAFPGHKGLYGPQGIGAVYINPKYDLIPLLHGGTGSQSELVDQPEERPTKYESGTLNTPGIAGLLEGLKFVFDVGVNTIWEHEQHLTNYTVDKLIKMKGIQVYGPEQKYKRAPVISFNMDDVNPQEVATILDEHYDIATRAGLHCTPLAHQSEKTNPEGSVRVSFGYFNKIEEIDCFLSALEEIRLGLLGK